MSVKKCTKSVNILTVVTEEKVSAVRRLFADDPGRSIRNTSSASGPSYKRVRDILHKNINFKPWKPKPEDNDYLGRDHS